MKNNIIVVLLFSAISVASAQTYVSGAVSGVWDSTGSPFYVTDSVCVPSGDSLRIGPGVEVIFQGHYKFCVDSAAVLKAIGTAEDSIIFTAEDTVLTDSTGGHHGIRFYKPAVGCSLSFCDIKYGNAFGAGNLISCYYFSLNTNSCGGGIYIEGSVSYHPDSLFITSSRIHHNRAFEYGGGVFIISGIAVNISKSDIEFNETNNVNGRGGALAGIGDSYSGSVVGSPIGNIENCIFHHNSSQTGGALYLLDCDLAFHHCTIVSNKASSHCGAISAWFGYMVFDVGGNPLLNSIVYNNYSPDVPDPQIDDWSWIMLLDAGNYIDSVAPEFVDTADFDYHFLSSSPCIDAGVNGGHFGAMTYISARPDDDFDGNPRPIGSVRDIGAYETLDTFHCVIPVNRGWNLFSIPSTTSEPTSTFGTSVFGYDRAVADYYTPDSLVNGDGYWALGMSLDTVEVPGNLPSFTDTLYRGWNLIGAIRYPIPNSRIVTEPAGLGMSSPYGWDGTDYFLADSLYPGKGYWFLSSGDGRITVGP